MDLARCSTCERVYKPSSRHKNCPACRAKSKRKKCPSCGNHMAAASKLCFKCTPREGAACGNWKGGKTIHKAGYVMVRVEGRYVFEHILVMEDYLGRQLLPEENIHHVNGVKDDNRLENLELWCKPQPTGVRVTDAIQWAKELLERYKGYELVSS